MGPRRSTGVNAPRGFVRTQRTVTESRCALKSSVNLFLNTREMRAGSSEEGRERPAGLRGVEGPPHGHRSSVHHPPRWAARSLRLCRSNAPGKSESCPLGYG